MRLLFFFCGLFVPLFVFAQESETERLVMQLRSASRSEQPDSVIILYRNLQKTDRKEARNSRNQVTIMRAYLVKDDIRSARRVARKICRKPCVWGYSLKMDMKLISKRNARESLFQYYYDHSNKKKAVKQLVKVTRKKQKFGCGYARGNWYDLRYEQIIGCYTDLGKIRKTEKYRRKREAL